MEYYLNDKYDNDDTHYKGIKRRLLFLSNSVYFDDCTGKEKVFDFLKMEEFFGYKNTDLVKRNISIVPDEVSKYKFILTIKMWRREYDLIYNNILQLPRDINNSIYSYLQENKEIKWSIEFPIRSPFENTIWKLIKYNNNNNNNNNNNGKDELSKRRIVEERKIEKIQCGMMTVTQFIDKEILLYLMTLDWFN